MKKVTWKVLFLVLLATSIASTAHAENINATVDVPRSCNVVDTDGVPHNYSAPSTNAYLGICALEAALSSGEINAVGFSNAYPDLGLFVISINEVSADSSSQYWALFQNGNFADAGLSLLPVVAGDEIKLDLQDFSGNSIGSSLTLHINSLVPEIQKGNRTSHDDTTITITVQGKVLGAETIKKFDVEKAYKFLLANQKEDGSFGESLYTDWATLGLASGNNQAEIIKLVKYFGNFKNTDAGLTDTERHAMALMALGLNPYDKNGENYIKTITDSFDGKQFGDANEDNDDIFAMIVLQNAGYGTEDKMIADDIKFILSKQKENGSWNESVDMTGAGIESLSAFSKDEIVKNALAKAREFLKSNQKDDGSFGNISSTTWAIEGIIALKEKPEDWKKNDNTPFDFLATNQDADGGIKNENIANKIWETAYAVKAFSNKTWNETMQTFMKPKDAGVVLGASTPNKTEEPKGVVKKIVKKNKIETPLAPKIDNSATVLNSAEEKNSPETKNKEQGWFTKFINFIF